MSYLVFAWLATLIYASVAIASKLVTKYSISNPWLMNFLWSLFLAVNLWIVGFVMKVGLPIAWGSLIITGVLNALLGIFYVLALYRLDISVLSPLSNIRTAITALLSVLLLGEVLLLPQYFLILLIFLSGVAVTYNEKLKLKSFLRPAVGLAFMFLIFGSLWSVSIKQSITDVGYWPTAVWSYTISVICLSFTTPLFWKDLRKIKFKQIGNTFLLSIGSLLATLASFKALGSNVSISSAILNLPLAVVIAFLFSFFAPRLLEKHSIKVYLIRFTATIIMILSALKLSHQ